MTIVEKKEIIISFLRQCNTYSDQMIRGYAERIGEGTDVEVTSGKVLKWSAYKEFNTRAIQELGDTVLDDWFEPESLNE